MSNFLIRPVGEPKGGQLGLITWIINCYIDSQSLVGSTCADRDDHSSTVSPRLITQPASSPPTPCRVAGLHLVGDTLMLIDRARAGALRRVDMNEGIVAAFLGRDETIAVVRI